MKLRKLEPRDAPLMLEWMHDADAVAHLNANFAAKTETDCLAFIQSCEGLETDLHLAVADENGIYMGTVSLKHIDRCRKDAEFAIALRRCAMGKGYARFAMTEILQQGHEKLGLNRIFWCVSPENRRAVRFYEKAAWPRTDGTAVDALRYYTPQQLQDYLWYCSQA